MEEWTEWLIELIGEDEWSARRAAIGSFLTHAFRRATGLLGGSFVPRDQASWHVYICEQYVRDPANYPLAQGSRHIPVVKRIMERWSELARVPGFRDRVVSGLRKGRDQFDSTLFELLTAAAYVRDGWSNVEFLSESRREPRPDFVAERGQAKLFVECKRKSRVSLYAATERERWLKLFEPVGEVLRQHRLPWVLDIVFHVPLESLPDRYLIDRIVGRLPLAVPGILVDDGELTIRIRRAMIERVQRELRQQYIRADASRLPFLLFDYTDPSKGVTSVYLGRPREGLPHVLDELDWAAGAIWSVDAPTATAAKARYLKRDLASAVRQLPKDSPGAVHWGLDVYEGELVEAEIYKRTVDSVSEFESDRLLKVVYAHLFEFTVPPDGEWDVRETVHWFDGGAGSEPYELENRFLLAE